jgi:hypothetical protein
VWFGSVLKEVRGVCVLRSMRTLAGVFLAAVFLAAAGFLPLGDVFFCEGPAR